MRCGCGGIGSTGGDGWGETFESSDQLLMKQKLNMKQLRPAARSAVMGLYGRIGRLTQQLKKALAWSDKIEQRFHDQRQRLITTQYARDLALGSASAAGEEKEHWKERAKRAEAELVGKRIAAAGEAGAL